jgi:hypothetical protein
MYELTKACGREKMMKGVLATLLLCCAVYSTAQSIGPASPMKFESFELAAATPPSSVEPLAPRTNFWVENTSRPATARSSNRTFMLLATVSAAAMVADVELTANCVKTVSNCREANPFMGSNPSRARLYGVNVPIYAGEMMLSRMFRRKYPERKLWMFPLLSFTGAHVAGAASNVSLR